MMTRLLLLLLLSLPLLAGDDEPKKPWSNSTKLSMVSTDGNSESQTLGFANEFKYEWAKSDLEIKASGVNVETTKITRRATGTPDDFNVEEIKDSERTAENYHFTSKYNHNFNKRLFWFAGLDWKTDKFAGIDSKTAVSAGLGNILIKNKRTFFKVDYGLQATREEEVFDDPNDDTDYTALRLSTKWTQKVSSSTNFSQDFFGETNLDESGDVLLILDNKIAANINSSLSLDVGLKFTHDTEPAFIGVNLYPSADATTPTGTVRFQKEELDTTFTTSLSINF